MTRTGIVPIIKLVNQRIEDLRFAQLESGPRREAYYALCRVRNYLIIARDELHKAAAEDAAEPPMFQELRRQSND
jgi:hypothetical protein